MKKIADVLKKNFGWKLISLFAASLMWLMVVNITNPVIPESYTVPLKIIGEDSIREKSYVLLNADELKQTSINVRVTGSRSNLARFNKNENINAYINLTPIDIYDSMELGKRQTIRVKCELVDVQGITLTYVSQEEVNIVLDKYVTKSIPVTVHKLDEDKEGYISADPITYPVEIVVGGPLSAVSTIGEVKTDIYVGEAVESFMRVQPVTVLDIEGKDITEKLDLDVAEVEIGVQVDKFARIPVSIPGTTGRVADGYRITAVTISPNVIEVEGNSNEIKALSTIELMDIDVSGISRTKVEVFDIRSYLASTNLNIREGTATQVRATVTVEPVIVREIIIPIEKIEILGVTGGVLLPTGDASVSVRGVASDIDRFENSDYLAYIDISDRSPGEYMVPVQLNLPDGLSLVGTEPISVTIFSDAAEPEEEPEKEPVTEPETKQETEE